MYVSVKASDQHSDESPWLIPEYFRRNLRVTFSYRQDGIILGFSWCGIMDLPPVSRILLSCVGRGDGMSQTPSLTGDTCASQALWFGAEGPSFSPCQNTSRLFSISSFCSVVLLASTTAAALPLSMSPPPSICGGTQAVRSPSGPSLPN